MASFLVYYGTGEGQTAKVAGRIAQMLADRGHQIATVDAARGPRVAVTDYNAVIVGASIHVGRHQPEVVAFARDQRDALAARPTAFFQVSLSSAVDDEARRAEAARYVESFVEQTGWHPDRVALLGGALRYSEYGFLKRQLIRRIAKGATGDTDTSRDYEYTNWAEVEAFAADVAAFVEAERGAAGAPGPR